MHRIDQDADPGVELLERALAYTSGALATVTPGDLALPTPCHQWRLADLLGHMEDSLDAFTEGACGAIGLRSAAPSAVDARVAALRTKACGLLGSWSHAESDVVLVGGHPVPVPIISRLAAIEIAVHGWDVGRTTSRGAPLPDPLAAALLPTARVLLADRHDEFGPALPVTTGSGAAVTLLGLLGRDAGWLPKGQ